MIRWHVAILVMLCSALSVCPAQTVGQIVWETYRDDNWELYLANADGSNPVNLTRTPDVDELYPHVSPDGAKISFVADEGEGDSKTRSVYTMSLDGTGRVLVARNARQPCWSPDGSAIAYLKGEFERFSYLDYATRELFIYDLKTQKHTQHPNKKLHHLYNICWSPDGNWFVATVHGGMGFKHALLAIEANGTGVFNLGINGCRAEVSPDGKRIAWGPSDWVLAVADLDLNSSEPRVTNRRDVVKSSKPTKVYHADWSPDGRLIAFSRGPATKSLGHAPEIVGIKAKGWDVCVADATGKGTWAAITTDGNSNKEPDWAPVKAKDGRGESSATGKAPTIITSATGVKMVLIPGGWLDMGSRQGDADEAPVHRVWVDGFYMDQYEVTQGQYGELVLGNPSHFKGPRNPMEQVSWAAAASYCNARSRAEGLEPCYDEDTAECDPLANGYRLPTEAEWEYACRAGTDTEYSFGTDVQKLAGHAWYAANSSNKTHPVGEKEPNPWGLHDMYGNVAEWCNDIYDPTYYSRSPEKNPQGPADGEKFIIRGGAWSSSADRCRSSCRLSADPGFQDPCFRRDDIGFRCVRGTLKN